nr:hypothetical protein [Tanacetum cinerariifolium]
HGKSSLQDASQSFDMLESEDIVYSDRENVGAEADFNNLETSITFLHHSSANSWQWDLHFSGSGNTFHWQWELILLVGTLSWQWECLVHFIPNNPPLNLMLLLHSSFPE